MRNNTGANATSVIEHRGTGDFIFKTVDNANLYFQTGSTNRVFVESNSGALNVANSSAVFLSNTGEQLIVNGSAKFANTLTANSLVKSGGTSTQYLMADGSTSTLTNPITGTGVSGQVAYWSGTNTQVGSNNLFWDATNNRLGINNATPAQAFDLVGNALIKGSGNTSATTALSVQDSASTNLLRMLNDGTLKIGTQNVDILPTANGSTVGTSGRGLIISTSTGTQTTGAVKIVGASTLASGSDWSLWLSHSFAPASGTATHSGLLLNQTINQTGGANGITRGLYVNPTLTAAADWRAIESLGKVIFTGETLTGSRADSLLSVSQTWNTTGSPALIYGNLTNTASGGGSSLFRLDIGGTQTFNIAPSGFIKFGTVQGVNSGIGPIDPSTGGSVANGLGLGFYMSGGSHIGYDFYFRNYTLTRTATSGVNGSIRTTVQFNPTSGNGTFDIISIGNTINQTGGANGITRGLYVNPNLTAAADWRSIEWSNNTGWGLYGVGTAPNYLGGTLTIGGTYGVDRTLFIGRNMTGSTSFNGILNEGIIQTDVTTSAIYYRTQARGANGLALTNIVHYYAQQQSLGTGSTLTNQFGYHAESSLVGATNNYGFYGNIASGTGRWNLYMNGTAANYLNGNTLIGSTTDSGEKLQVNGTMKVTGASTFSSTITSTQFRLSALNTAPATAASTGTLGEIRIDADYIYICTATNTWKRVEIATW